MATAWRDAQKSPPPTATWWCRTRARRLGPEWEPLKRLDRPGEVESFARHLLKTALDPLKSKSFSSEHELSQAASEVRDGLASVLGWPEGLDRMRRRTGIDPEGLAAERELRLEGCGIGEQGAGAVAVLLRASRALESVDLGDNALGDKGATLIADVLRHSTNLRTLRLHGNAIGGAGGGALAAMLSTNRGLAKLDLRGNRFDSLSESALRKAGAVSELYIRRHSREPALLADAVAHLVHSTQPPRHLVVNMSLTMRAASLSPQPVLDFFVRRQFGEAGG